jgi:hypothetical protein
MMTKVGNIGIITTKGQTMKDFLPFREDVTVITGHRDPTRTEVRMGYGARHYKTFPRALWEHPNGKPKKWIKCPQDGLRYFRG